MNQRKPAQPPGSLIYVGDEMKHTIHMEGVSYDQNTLEEFKVRKVEDLPDLTADKIHWINLTGIHRTTPVRTIGERFQIPQLTLEDIMNTEQRPKIDLLDNQLFIVIKMLYLHEGQIAYEHLSIIIGENYVLTFQEQPWDVFEPVLKRITQAGGRIRSQGADYLAYAMIDAVVDNYLIVCDHLESEIEALEEEIFEDTKRDSIHSLHAMQRELIFLTKTFRGGREVLARIMRCDSEMIKPRTRLYLEDVNDHMMQAVESVEVYREMVNGLDNLHFSMINQKTNDTIKVLTLYASIFLPLTFVVGIYGMNFKHMPELEWKYGYAGIMFFMLLMATGMFVYFRKKKWL